ncbi:MAG: LacI family transcriptional regulator [Bifidobacteriaceae bacterium]|nr:LacI family transcriptional regulator [Bifidobacteriaceae bacterium]
MRRPSLKDVARAAGVSYQTVSRVVNGAGRVSAATRQRVEEAIGQVGYKPSSLARSLITGRSQMVGLMADGCGRLGGLATLAAVERAAREAGYDVIAASTGPPDPAAVVAALDRFERRRVEGVVLIAPSGATLRAVGASGGAAPAVLLACAAQPAAGFTAFGEDQGEGARLAARHLAGLGHRDIAHVAGAPGWLDGEARMAAFRAELELLGIAWRPPVYGDWSGESGYQAGRRLLEGAPPTAVFAASDLMALGLIRAFCEAGWRVPEDISVVGFDDAAFAAQACPPLTTVGRDLELVGRRCVEILTALMRGEQPDTAAPSWALAPRASCAPPRRRPAGGGR